MMCAMILAMAGFALRQQHAPGILTHSLPIPQATEMVCDAARGIEFKQMANGRIATYLPAAKAATFDFLTLGFRPMPLDGFPVVGALLGAAGGYTVVTHSGVTLAPYRPGRFGTLRSSSCKRSSVFAHCA